MDSTLLIVSFSDFLDRSKSPKAIDLDPSVNVTGEIFILGTDERANFAFERLPYNSKARVSYSYDCY